MKNQRKGQQQGFKAVVAGLLLVLMSQGIAFAQTAKREASQVFYQLRERMNTVQDYTADVRMKIDVRFMRVPLLAGKLYFKSPGKLRLERNGGISVMPRKSINLSFDQMMPSGNVTVIDAGADQVAGRPVRILKVIPDAEGDIVLTKVWVDESRMLALRTETTTRENGTVQTELTYGKYEKQALPDRIVFIMDVKEYKLPKGVTMDYDEGAQPAPAKGGPQLPKKGRIEIRYLSYQINTGLSDALFK